MSSCLTLLMAQINPTVGAVAYNVKKIIDIIQTHQHDHDLIIFPELALTGYPPEDLLFRKDFFTQLNAGLEQIKNSIKNCHVIMGHPTLEDGIRYNSVSIIANGTTLALYHKQHLPNYGVFDEKRYFQGGKKQTCLFTLKKYRLGVCICEDMWQPGPTEALLEAKADAIISINASPFDVTKYSQRESLMRAYAKQGTAIIYVNQVGGQDELLFDGQSFIVDNTGKVRARAPAFMEHLQTIRLQEKTINGPVMPLLSPSALIYEGLVCGLKNYVEKNKFPGVLLGLSGGIDSALTLCIAVDALGASRVQAVMMPSRFTANMSLEDAKQQAKTLHVDYTTMPIEPAFHALLTTLAPYVTKSSPGIMEENLQARIRCALLMALSNKTGRMLLTTSNKSETAVGYCTLYGDMAGGFGVLKDVLKTRVYELAHYRNSLSATPIIPLRVLQRAPSAELANDQTDQDTLPEYALLDAILQDYMENNLSAGEIIQKGYAAEDVFKIVKLIQQNEYKRRQAPPGIKITPCAFGRDWRYPLTSGFQACTQNEACKIEPNR